MMYWQEQSDDKQEYTVPDDIVDLSFRIDCKCLQVDHAHDLATALQRALPWLIDEKNAGIHQIHVANSQNGWIRPDKPDELLYPSRRTRMILRLPRHRVDDAATLTGQILAVGEHELEVRQSTTRLLSPITTIYAHYVDTEQAENEDAFLEHINQRLQAMDIQPRKMLCGTAATLRTAGSQVYTRSLLLAGLTVDESITLQQTGLGPNRLLGCGLFIPHKDIDVIPQRKE